MYVIMLILVCTIIVDHVGFFFFRLTAILIAVTFQETLRFISLLGWESMCLCGCGCMGVWVWVYGCVCVGVWVCI